MRVSLAVVLAAVLLPAGLAAQKVPPVKNAPARVMELKDAPVQQAQATNAALVAVRAQLQRGALAHTWPIKSGGAIAPASVKGAGALFNPTGGKNGTPVWVVGVTSPNGKGTVRVFVNAMTGAVVPGAQSASFSWGMWDWGMAPTHWKQGLSSPTEKKGEDTLTVKPSGGEL